jgi:hypothetical protein
VRAARALLAAALLAPLLAGGAGCSYFSARWRDFTDIASVGIGPGGGLGVRAGATRLFAVEVMAQKDESFVGWRARNWRWTESSYGIPFSFWRMPSLGEEKVPERGPFDIITTSRRRTLYPNRPEVEDLRHTLFVLSRARGLRTMDLLNVELGASALIGGVEVGVRPLEIVDFLLGWFTIDIGRDDAVKFGTAAAREEPGR